MSEQLTLEPIARGAEGYRLKDDRGREVARVWSARDDTERARRMCASSDLLSACEALMARYADVMTRIHRPGVWSPDDDEEYEIARLAVAKANGGDV